MKIFFWFFIIKEIKQKWLKVIKNPNSTLILFCCKNVKIMPNKKTKSIKLFIYKNNEINKNNIFFMFSDFY